MNAILSFGLAFALISYISSTSSNRFELVTDTNFDAKFLSFTLFFGAIFANYSGMYLLWRSPNVKLAHYYLISTGLLVLVLGIANINWLDNVSDIVQNNFDDVTFPNDVDELTLNIKKSIIWKNTIFFGLLSIIGFCASLLGATHLRHLKK